MKIKELKKVIFDHLYLTVDFRKVYVEDILDGGKKVRHLEDIVILIGILPLRYENSKGEIKRENLWTSVIIPNTPKIKRLDNFPEAKKVTGYQKYVRSIIIDLKQKVEQFLEEKKYSWEITNPKSGKKKQCYDYIKYIEIIKSENPFINESKYIDEGKKFIYNVK